MRNFIVGICAAIAILWLWAMLSKPTSTPPIQTPEVQTDFKDAYMKGCIGDSGGYEFCNCTYNYMVNKVGLTKFYDISVEYVKTGVYPQLLLDAVKVCQ